APVRVVVLGGRGEFGARVMRLLGDGFTVLAPARAELDVTAADFAARLAALEPGVVVHCAGPFQSRDNAVASAALACNAHYVDLADARDFVVGIGALDREARARDRLVVSGASSVPGLSSA